MIYFPKQNKMDYSKRVFNHHSWLRLIGQKWRCTKCGTIKSSGKHKPSYNKNGVEYDASPDCSIFK